jgi:arsenate reductase
MSQKPRVLIICQHNSGRSQIAEAYLKKWAGDQLEVESAGLEPAPMVNPLVVEVMREEGIDMSRNEPQSVFRLFQEGRLYDHVITVCDETEMQCPVFPGITRRWHMPFPDPAAVEGTDAEKLEKVRQIRNRIKERLLNPAEGELSFKALLQ